MLRNDDLVSWLNNYVSRPASNAIMYQVGIRVDPTFELCFLTRFSYCSCQSEHVFFTLCVYGGRPLSFVLLQVHYQ